MGVTLDWLVREGVLKEETELRSECGRSEITPCREDSPCQDHMAGGCMAHLRNI